MPKRTADDLEHGIDAYLKRQKISNPAAANSKSADQIRSARQLRQLLSFDQDTSRSKKAIQSFKAFLDGFADKEDDSTHHGRASILKEYLESQKPTDDEDETSIYLVDLMKTWSFASTSNDDGLLCAVPAVLGLLLKTISSRLELSEYGLRLGRTLLLKNQQELLARGLTASKDWVISPSLRLLRELISFDGGALANKVFRARDQMFRGLAKCLRQKKEGDEVEDRRRPSVRTNAVRVLLAAIRLLSAKEKRELLNGKELITALIKHIYQDPPFMIREILETLKTSVLQNEDVPREAKTRIVNANSLKQLATLYRYHQVDEELSIGKKSVDTVAHEFLTLACTSPDLGVLNRQAGFYPRGIDPDNTVEFEEKDETKVNLGLTDVKWIGQSWIEIPVRNTILSEFIQNLSPWSNIKHSELLLTVLRHAPELFADYFTRKKDFSFEPKLTATWIGYAAFLFSALQLPIPPYFGHQMNYAKLPPPTSVVLENLLPQALNQKAFTRCLKLGHKLITFFAIRLLCVALTKFRTTIKMYQDASTPIWAGAAEQLTTQFCEKLPSIKDVIAAFRSMRSTDLLQREGVTKLLVLYYESILRTALESKFDPSATIAEVLTGERPTLSPEDRVLQAMEVENIFQFANFSPGMRWFAKAGGLTISPFMAMLKLAAEAPADFPLLKLRGILDSVVEVEMILQVETSIPAIDNLILRLQEVHGPSAAAVWEFLDDCVSRCVSKVIKYANTLEDFREEIHQTENDPLPVSLLTLVIVEQWPFVAKSANAGEIQAIAEFIASYLAGSISIKEDEKILELITRSLVSSTPGSSAKLAIEGSAKLVHTIVVPEARSPEILPLEVNDEPDLTAEAEKLAIAEHLLASPEAPADPQELVRWNTKDVDDVIGAGHAAALIKLLSSEEFSVRKQAATAILKFASKLKASSFEEKDQIWLLLGEVVETSRQIEDDKPLPSIITAFASSAIAVLNDPLHCLYEKVNSFLSKGPTWDVDKVPLMYRILDEAPSLDDAHYFETAWLLNYMLSGLRTEADMRIFQKRKVFEKLFTLYNNPHLAAGLREKLLKILYRATMIEGGSNTLVMRCSAITWLEAQIALGGGIGLRVLLERIVKSCDQKPVGAWSKGGVEKAITALVKF